MPYLRAVGSDDGAASPAGVEELRAKMDELLAEQERALQLRKVSIAITGVGVIVGIVRLGDILRQIRKERRQRQS